MEMQQCPRCLVVKERTLFPPSRWQKHDRQCNACIAEKMKAWRLANPERERAIKRRYILADQPRALLRRAKQGAGTRGIFFCIGKEDLGVIPARCPVCSVEMVAGVGRQHGPSPSVDRLDPGKGYVPGNVWVICYRCNQLKDNMTVADMRHMADVVERAMS